VNATGRCRGIFDDPLNPNTDCLTEVDLSNPGCNDSCIQSYVCNTPSADFCCTDRWSGMCRSLGTNQNYDDICAAGIEGLCFESTTGTTGAMTTGVMQTTGIPQITGTVLFIYLYI